jgi:hypothetical protein
VRQTTQREPCLAGRTESGEAALGRRLADLDSERVGWEPAGDGAEDNAEGVIG